MQQRSRPALISGRTPAEAVTWLGVWGNLSLIVIKITVGTIGRSQALLADGIHSLSDLVSDAVTLVALKIGRQPSDRGHHYGHGKVEDLAALGIGVILIIAAVLLARNAILIFHEGQIPERSLWLLAAALLSVLIKEWLFRRTRRVARETGSPTLAANAAHHRSDALSSLATLVGISLFLVHPEFTWADTAAALLVSVFIIKAGITICWEACRDLVDSSPPDEAIQEMGDYIRALPGVLCLGALRARLYAGQIAADLDICVDADLTVREGHDIAERLEAQVLKHFPSVRRVMVHIEPAEFEGQCDRGGHPAVETGTQRDCCDPEAPDAAPPIGANEDL